MSTRITQRMMTDRSVASLQVGMGRVAKVQEQLSTGRVLNRPSDSPTDTARAMRVRSALADNAQYTRNAQDGQARLDIADQKLGSITTQVRQARLLGLQGANSGAMPASARQALAVEIDALRTSVLSDANATYLDRPVFGGITAGTAAYDSAGAFVGEAGAITRRVADGVQVRVDVHGPDALGDGVGSVFDELAALSDALRAGSDSGVQAGLGALARRLETIISAQAGVGATASRVEKATSALADTQLSLKSSLSEVENVDLPAATVELGMQQVAYQAALAATAKVMQPSLLDFLR